MLPAVSICRSRLRIHETCKYNRNGKQNKNERRNEIRTLLTHCSLAWHTHQYTHPHTHTLWVRSLCLPLWCLPSLKITNSALKSFAQVRLTALCVSRCCHRLLPHLLPTAAHASCHLQQRQQQHKHKAQSLLWFFGLECSYFFWEFVVADVAAVFVFVC